METLKALLPFLEYLNPDLHPIAYLWWLLFILSAIIAAVIFALSIGESGTMPATVISKSYTPERSSTGFGPTISGNGQVGTAMTFSSSDEAWTVIVKTGKGVIPVEVEDGDEWEKFKEGDAVTLEYFEGLFSGFSPVKIHAATAGA